MTDHLELMSKARLVERVRNAETAATHARDAADQWRQYADLLAQVCESDRTVIHALRQMLADARTKPAEPVVVPVDPDAAEHLAVLTEAIQPTKPEPVKRQQRPYADTVEDVEFLLDQHPGYDPALLADRLGYQRPDGLYQTLRRAGRPDLAERLLRNRAEAS